MAFPLLAKDYTKKSAVKVFINGLSKEYGLKKSYLNKLFKTVRTQKTALAVFNPKVRRQLRKIKYSKNKVKKVTVRKKPKRKLGSWGRYSRLKTNPSRVKQGVNFIKRHQAIFDKVEERFGIPKEYIAAIIGVETVYGGNVGKYPIFDTLTTLAFEKNRRNKFFKSELRKFIRLSQTERFNPKNVFGSFAGAIGLGQFMPSNYAAYGVDFNGDNRITLQRAPDAIASIANYLKKNGWRTGEPVATRVKYTGTRFTRYKTGYKKTYHRKSLKGITPRETWGYEGKVRLIKLKRYTYDELWYGAKNFFVITRYNHSAYYAMSIHQLATKIRSKLREN